MIRIMNNVNIVLILYQSFSKGKYNHNFYIIIITGHHYLIFNYQSNSSIFNLILFIYIAKRQINTIIKIDKNFLSLFQ